MKLPVSRAQTDTHRATYTHMCTEMSLCIDVAGFGTIPVHCGRRAVLAGALESAGPVGSQG